MYHQTSKSSNHKAQQTNRVPPPSKQRLARIMGTSLESDATSPSASLDYQQQQQQQQQSPPTTTTNTLTLDSDSWDDFEENEQEIDSEANDNDYDDDEDDDDDALFTESESDSPRNYSHSVLPAVSHESSNIHNSYDMDDVSTTRSQVSASASTITSASGGPTAQDQAELRRTVQALFELEESLLNQHMSNIQENAEMLTKEGKLLQMVQAGTGNATTNTCTQQEMDLYAVTLAEYLDRKEYLISKLQGKLAEFQVQLVKEQELAQRVTQLSQY